MSIRYSVFKDYYRDNDHLTDQWPFLYATQAEADAAKAQLQTGYDRSWFDPADVDASAFLYVDILEI